MQALNGPSSEAKRTSLDAHRFRKSYHHLHRPQVSGLWLLQQQLIRNCTTAPATITATNAVQQSGYELIEERGVQFTPGSAFYRAESAQGRDLAVLAAAVYKQQHGQLRVLDVMAGSGMRGARYLSQADADLVWCNDYDTRNNAALVFNLVNALQQQHSSSSSSSGCGINGQQQQVAAETLSASLSANSSSSSSVKEQAAKWTSEAEVIQYEGIRGDMLQWTSSSSSSGSGAVKSRHHADPQQQQQQCQVSHVEARRLLSSTYLAEDYFDLVDVDSFGSDTSWLPAAIAAVKYGGMLYITSTDGFCSSGKRPERSLAAYGAYLRALPHANEQGLRMLIGAAVREGAAQGIALRPLFSLYSYHGPVFRVMLRAERSKEGAQLDHYGFVGHCYVHGENRRVGWRGLSQAWCRCQQIESHQKQQPAEQQQQQDEHQPLLPPPPPQQQQQQSPPPPAHSSPTPLVLSGPMWTGPLHDTEFIAAMMSQADSWGWRGSAVPDDSPHIVRQSKNNRQRPLEVLLSLLHHESSPSLPPWYIRVSTLAQHLNTTPSRDKLIAALRARGYVACLCHIEHRALRSNATTQQILQVAVEDCGYKYRSHHQLGPGATEKVLRQQQQQQQQQNFL